MLQYCSNFLCYYGRLNQRDSMGSFILLYATMIIHVPANLLAIFVECIHQISCICLDSILHNTICKHAHLIKICQSQLPPSQSLVMCYGKELYTVLGCSNTEYISNRHSIFPLSIRKEGFFIIKEKDWRLL